VLVVSDRNTVGLGGEIRANRSESGLRRSDFVQFLRNVGEGSDHELGGGTYGFGKGVFYRLSRCGAILVNTHTDEPGQAGRRLMGAALGPNWTLGATRYTGRHWWGQVADDDVPDPIMGAEADDLAAVLGLPRFADGRTGTDIVVIAADLGVVTEESEGERPRSTNEAARYLTSAILWNLWPKMIPDSDGRRMSFAVGVDGDFVEVPSPMEIEALAPFVESLSTVRNRQGRPYSRTRPPKLAGTMSLTLTDAAAWGRQRDLLEACPFEGPPHHVARMRTAELVVDYWPGPPHPDQRFGYGAVFKASIEADRSFAAAEPPTHDDWGRYAAKLGRRVRIRVGE
jgi:hypothetical protein